MITSSIAYISKSFVVVVQLMKQTDYIIIRCGVQNKSGQRVVISQMRLARQTRYTKQPNIALINLYSRIIAIVLYIVSSNIIVC